MFPHQSRALRGLQKDMVSYWSVPLWWDPNDVPHRRILPSYQAERWSVSSSLCWWCCYCLVDQLWVLIAYARRSNLLLLTVCAVQVFFSSYVFSTNVMVKVATRPAVNPVGQRFVTIIIIIILKNNNNNNSVLLHDGFVLDNCPEQ